MEHKYTRYVQKNKYKIIKCESCGYWHVFPMPTENEIINYYKKEYYNTVPDPAVKDKLNDDPDNFYYIQYNDRLRHITKLLPFELPKSIIDIGAGYGDFLNFMKLNGWAVQGIEPSVKAYKNIKDKTMDIKLGNINNISELKLNPSSVITLNNVLEHLKEPRKTLEIIKKYLLLKKGILLIIVPNEFNILQHLLMNTVLKKVSENHYYWVSPPAHLNYWSHKTIKNFLESCGFNVQYIISDFPMEIFPLIGDNYITYPELGRKAHLKRVKFEKFFSKVPLIKFKDTLYKFFAKIGLGRATHVYASI